ncbi:hypothetical protein B484DRAFT_446066 [Ochromonadaceae sp. CCMP2298]|nr:hypothetical protein B484DRAFT_446066 [Ochromonadaceae sp. CCMP2298]
MHYTYCQCTYYMLLLRYCELESMHFEARDIPYHPLLQGLAATQHLRSPVPLTTHPLHRQS